MGSPDGAAKCHVFYNLPNNIPKQGRTQRGGGSGATAPAEKTIFTIFRMSLLSILWIFGTFIGI
jgi:hypothetical protein